MDWDRGSPEVVAGQKPLLMLRQRKDMAPRSSPSQLDEDMNKTLLCKKVSLLPSSIVPYCKVCAGLATVVLGLVPQANLLLSVQHL